MLDGAETMNGAAASYFANEERHSDCDVKWPGSLAADLLRFQADPDMNALHATHLEKMLETLESTNRIIMEQMSTHLWSFQEDTLKVGDRLDEARGRILEERDRAWASQPKHSPNLALEETQTAWERRESAVEVVQTPRAEKAKSASPCGTPMHAIEKSSPSSQETMSTTSAGRASTSMRKSKSVYRREMQQKMDDALAAGGGPASPKLPGNHFFEATCGSTLFPDEASMVLKAKEAMQNHKFSIADYFYDSGISQYIARQLWFENATMMVIGANAIWIAIEADGNTSDFLPTAQTHFQVMENFFCCYFFWEWIIRFSAFRYKRNCFLDRWFSFDTVLLVLMICDTWLPYVLHLASSTSADAGLGSSSVLKIGRLIRLSRMARILKILRHCPELLVMVKAAFMSLRAVFFTMCLMIIQTYVFAILAKQVNEGTQSGEMYFDTVPDAMKNLLIAVLFPDLQAMIQQVGDESFISALLVSTFVFFASFTSLNMLVGVLVETVAVVSHVEKEQAVISIFQERIEMLLQEAEVSEEDTLTQGQFSNFLLKPHWITFMKEVGIDVIALVEYLDIFFKDGRTVTYRELTRFMLDFRGGNRVTVKDIVDLRKWIDRELRESQKALLRDITESLYKLPCFKGLTSSTKSVGIGGSEPDNTCSENLRDRHSDKNGNNQSQKQSGRIKVDYL